MNNIKRALISVWDKTGIEELAQFLNTNNIEIISTGGTKSAIEKTGIPVISVSDIINQKEIMDGRVKTLHPSLFGGILADRENKSHLLDLASINSLEIDLVVINLYPFESEAVENKLDLEKAIENIDIGGPSMLRAAAKNFKNVIPLCNPRQYSSFILSYKNNNGLWDSGDLKTKTLPEITFSYPEEIELRKNWDIILNWNLITNDSTDHK